MCLLKQIWALVALVCGAHSQPNILLFVADDLGIGDVGIFGNTSLRTPNIDSIGRRGAVLSQHLTAAPTCTPSRAAFLTGRYPIRTGMSPDSFMSVLPFVACRGGLPQQEVTIAEIAKQAGYHTALIGKWHLGMYCDEFGSTCHHPLDQGFDYFYGIPLTNLKDFGVERDGSVIDAGGPVARRYTLVSTFVCLVTVCAMCYANFIGRITTVFLFTILVLTCAFVLIFLNNVKIINSVLMRNYDFIEQPIRLDNNLTQRLVNEGTTFIENSVKNERPFLLMMSWIQVHTAMHASTRFDGKSKHGRYGDNVEELDWSVGEIMKVLERLGQDGNTLVYFTSDNGGHNEEHDIYGNQEGGYNGIFRGGKGQATMDGALRVPTVAMWPGVISPGLVIDRPTSLMDVFPTVRHILQIPPTDVIVDGKNLMPAFTGVQNSDDHHDVLFHYCNTDIHGIRYFKNNITWKLHYTWPSWTEGAEGCFSHHICNCNDVIWLERPILFNMNADPSEQNPLDLDMHSSIVSEMERLKLEHMKTVMPVQSEFRLSNIIWRPWLQHCCNFPWCNCKEE